MAKDKYKIQVGNDNLELTSSVVMNLGQPPARKAEEYLDAYEGYVYTASGAIAQEVASVDLKLFKIKYVKDEPVTTEVFVHPALSVLQYVNEFMTFYELTEATQVYLELVGEAFWVVLRDERTKEPREIWPIRPDWVKVVPDSKEVVSEYIYNPGGLPTDNVHIPKENMIHFKYFNPKNPYRGRGSVQAAAMPLDIHKFAQDWNRNFFFNSALPGLVFTNDKKFNKRAIQRFVEQWQGAYAGRQNSHKVAFLGGGFKLEKVSQGARELDFSEQQKIMRDDILAVFRVPKTILGLTEDVNRANAEATTRAFMERVVTPRMVKYVGTLQEKFLPMFKLAGDYMFDFTDPSPEDSEAKLKMYANGRQYSWLTPNEIRVWENLEPIEGGDSLGPMTGSAEDPEEDPNADPNAPTSNEPDTDVDDPADDDANKGLLKVFTKFFPKKKTVRKVFRYTYKKPFKHMMKVPTKRIEVIKREELTKSLSSDLTRLISELMKNTKPSPTIKPARYKGVHEELWTEDARTAYWLNFSEKATRQEMALRQRIIPLFEEMEREVLDKLENIKSLSKEKRKEKEDEALPDVVKWTAIWLAVMLPFLRELIYLEGNAKLDMVDATQDFDLTSEAVSLFLRDRLLNFVTSINQTTRDDLARALSEGIANGESIADLRSRVEGVMEIAKTDRAVMIARTETIRSSNFAAVEAYRQSSVVVAKEWLTQRDGNVCPFCGEMEGKQIVLEESYFKKGDKFIVEGKTMKIEVDDVPFPPLHTNCRCTLIPVLADSSKSFDENQEKDAIDDVIKGAKTKASKMVSEAVEKASSIVETAQQQAEMLQKEKKQEAVEKATIEADKIVKLARKQAQTLIDDASKQAKVEKKTLLGELRSLRESIKAKLYGEQNDETK